MTIVVLQGRGSSVALAALVLGLGAACDDSTLNRGDARVADARRADRGTPADAGAPDAAQVTDGPSPDGSPGDGPAADAALPGDGPAVDAPLPGDGPAVDSAAPDLVAADQAPAPDAPPADASSVADGPAPGDTGVAPDLGPVTGIVVNRTHIGLFEQIPPAYLAAARGLKMVFSDRSVGDNINNALNCLTATTFGLAPAACRRDWDAAAAPFTVTKLFTQADYDANAVPARIRFTPDPLLYDRSNWAYEARSGSWSELTQDFIGALAPQYIGNGYQVLSYQFSYLNVDATDDIASPTTGFFSDNPSKYDVHDLEAFIAQHTDRVFIFWTTSLARGIGTQVAKDFNEQLRQYAGLHGKILFDVADIESHTDTDAPCWDNRDGVEYCRPGSATCENHADDGLQLPAMCQDYTTEVDGGHLGAVSGAQIRIVKAFWVLMARIAGWNP